MENETNFSNGYLEALGSRHVFDDKRLRVSRTWIEFFKNLVAQWNKLGGKVSFDRKRYI